MKILTPPSLLILALISLFLSCKKSELDDSLWDCDMELHLDSLETQNYLIGIWEWNYYTCSGFIGKNETDFAGLSIEFKPDNSLEIQDNGTIPQSSTWKIVPTDSGLFSIETTPAVPQIRGRIFFCDNRVLFNESYIDICDHYFTKKE